jgi:hypothetical protein
MEGRMMSDKTLITVQRYRHSSAEDIVNVTDSVTTLAFVQDIHGREDIKLTVLDTADYSKRMFTPGDYTVVRDLSGHTMAWGRVLTRRTSITRSPGGTLTNQPYLVTAAGWWDYLSRTMIHALHGDTNGAYAQPIGTLFPMIRWGELITDFASRNFGREMGAQLVYLFQRIARIRLPASLGGQWLGDAIPIVYDAATAARYAPRFSNIEAVDSGNLLPDRLMAGLGSRSTTVGGLLQSTFIPDPQLIELFPALVDGGTEPYNELATVLGKRPVLVYRVKPWRTEPLYQNTVARANYTAEDFERTITYAIRGGRGSGSVDDARAERRSQAEQVAQVRLQSRNKTRELLVDQRMFTQVTLNTADPGVVVPIHEKYIVRLDGEVSDADRVNAATINVTAGGDEQIDTLESAGLPIVVNDQIEKHGLRLYKINWPLAARDMSIDPEYYRTIAAQSMQFNMLNHTLEKGMLDLHFTRAVKVAEVEASDVTQAQTTFAPALDINPGQWFRTKIGDLPEYMGYVESVQHTIARAPSGALSARSGASFSRGHYVEVGDLVHTPLVPIASRTFDVGQLATLPPGVVSAVSALLPTVIPDRPPQVRSSVTKITRPPAPTKGNYFLWQGNQFFTDFEVIHQPVDVDDPAVLPEYHYYRNMRTTMPRKCLVHINAGPLTTNASGLWTYVANGLRGASDSKGAAAHIYIDPYGKVYQFFDLAIPVAHCATPAVQGAAPNEVNNDSIAIEFIVPAPIRVGSGRNPLTDKQAADLYATTIGQQPWRSLDEWRWMYSNSIDGSDSYRTGAALKYGFGPSLPQLRMLAPIATFLTQYLPIVRAAIPNPANGDINRAARSTTPAVQLAQFRNPAYGFFHHAQLSNNRGDAAGCDLNFWLRG